MWVRADSPVLGTPHGWQGMPRMKMPAAFSAELAFLLASPFLLPLASFYSHQSCFLFGSPEGACAGPPTLDLGRCRFPPVCLGLTSTWCFLPACSLDPLRSLGRPWYASESFVSQLSPLLLPGPHLWSSGGGEGSWLIPPSRSCCGS